MTTHTVDRSAEWETVPFAGGYRGLTELADDEFSGKVTAGRAQLFMLRGSIVGVFDGSIEDFEGADGTAREAPHPALPLLAVMQERSEAVRAKYYSEDTPLSEVNRTLEDGNFTGFMELSENVLSGDYYQVYHQGRSMSVAWVGASERLITDDEAFEQADDEVGIFEVRPVEVEIEAVPEPADDAADVAAAGTVGGEDAASAAEQSTDDTTQPAGGSSDPAGAGQESGGATAPEDAGARTPQGEPTPAGEVDRTAGEATEPTGSSTSGPSAGEESRAGGHPDQPRGTSPGGDGSDGPSAEPATGEQGGGGRHQRRDSGTAGSESNQGARREPTTSADPPGPPDPGSDRGGDPGHREPAGQDGRDTSEPVTAHDLEMRSLPSLDPDRTASARKQARGRTGSTGAAGAPGEPASDRARQQPTGQSRRDRAAGSGTADGTTEQAGSPADAGQPTGANGGRTEERAGTREGPGSGQGNHEAGAESDAADHGGGAETAKDRAEGSRSRREDRAAGGPAQTPPAGDRSAGEDDAAAVEAQVEEIDELRADLENLEGERDDLAGERDRLESQLAEAKSELERMRGRLEEAVGEGEGAERQLSPGEAVEATNLFVRYDSKGEATLESAHAGDADRADVEDNLRLEYHTAFEADDAAVDGQPFDDFLRETIQYRFAEWLVGELLYEIRDTGHESAMADLYDAIPRIDRIELNGIVAVTYTKNGDEHRTQEGFDVVARDRMGDALIVANINDSRDPATQGMMTTLVTAAERVGESGESLAGAFLVTRSYFEPESLETAAEATSGGLLSRDTPKSFVNLSRKDGYHLCLVEARNREFHLTVPEL